MPKKKKETEIEETEEIEDETEEIENDTEEIKIKNDESDKEETYEDEKEEIKEEKKEEEEEIDDEYKCMYKFTKHKQKNEEDILDDEKELKFDDDENIHDDIVEPEKRTTKRKLFHYEMVRVLSVRAKQLSLGAKPLVKNVTDLEPREIAKLELKEGILPFIIERVLPNGMKEQWKISELI